MIRAETFDVRVASARPLTSFVREIVLERIDARPMDFDAGQWVNLVLPIGAEGELRRAYSIASAPNGGPSFEIAVTRVEGGPGSEYLHALEPGATMSAIGPHGLFTRPAADPPCLFVATGTGVAPFRSMMQAALRAGSKAPLWLLFGVRFEADILYREELEGWAKQHPNVRVDVTLSRGSAHWTGRHGYVQQHVPELYRKLSAAAGGDAPHVLVCGLDKMVQAVRSLAREGLGADRKHVHVERYD
jgi:ferredoxin-NADP reductase